MSLLLRTRDDDSLTAAREPTRQTPLARRDIAMTVNASRSRTLKGTDESTQPASCRLLDDGATCRLGKTFNKCSKVVLIASVGQSVASFHTANKVTQIRTRRRRRTASLEGFGRTSVNRLVPPTI
jgi:hypothetical protein